MENQTITRLRVVAIPREHLPLLEHLLESNQFLSCHPEPCSSTIHATKHRLLCAVIILSPWMGEECNWDEEKMHFFSGLGSSSRVHSVKGAVSDRGVILLHALECRHLIIWSLMHPIMTTRPNSQ